MMNAKEAVKTLKDVVWRARDIKEVIKFIETQEIEKNSVWLINEKLKVDRDKELEDLKAINEEFQNLVDAARRLVVKLNRTANIQAGQIVGRDNQITDLKAAIRKAVKILDEYISAEQVQILGNLGY